ncbi:MAG TPA: class I SAM-dependent methyltransferase [Candidatus Obscuribacterales bacterium]
MTDVTLKASGGRWYETAAGILYVVRDTVQFEDDFSHWKNGFCRLLEIPETRARQLIEDVVSVAAEAHGRLFSDLSPDEKHAVLKLSIRRRYGFSTELNDAALLSHHLQTLGTGFEGERPDAVFAHSISGNRERMVVGCQASEFAWQVSTVDYRPVAAASVVYDRSYYDAPQLAHCGMRDYIRHEDWRLEKARRLVRTVLHGAGNRARQWLEEPGAVRTLDVGSATGYFRRAMDELGFEHHGIDVSFDAIRLCRETFGYDTWHGSVFDLPELAARFKRSFTMITLWDTIEHLDDPLAAVKLLAGFLSDDGLLVVRTPSLTAFEADILADMYYSFKLDHVRYFSPRSLTRLMHLAGLEQVYLETTSHLFRGLLGANYLFQMGKKLKGADIVALYSRPAGGDEPSPYEGEAHGGRL